MDRRTFIWQGSLAAAGLAFRTRVPATPATAEASLYALFQHPPAAYRPFVRWWWNGNRVECDELARELRLLQQAGIGGVEINPVKFPANTPDLGIKAIPWLSPGWMDLVRFACTEARQLGLACDLIVGSGWPFGGEFLAENERAQGVVVGTKKLQGPLDYEVSVYELCREADPTISSPFPGRKMDVLSVLLVPAWINRLEEATDLSAQVPSGTIKCRIPEGKYVLYALVRVQGFMEVIQGAPGAAGPVLDHYNEAAVRKYLDRMSGTLTARLGPLSQHFRSLFTDSLELEGANWCADLAAEFRRRRGYDLEPWLPFILFRITAMGNTWVYDHGAEFGPAFGERIRRMRYDFERTKAELIHERFLLPFVRWCRQNGLLARMQAYGRGYFPLEGSLAPDIPEGETWIRPGLGAEMSEDDYRQGRAYTMVNKLVSSAARLEGKKRVSSEELTNIHSVFNETLELMKVAGDQGILSGTNHPVFHGFNYAPPQAPFPGWVLYGTYLSERNPWWPYFPLFTAYRSRLSAVLQQAEPFADMAVLPATADLWSRYGAQNDPFPGLMDPPWQTLVWEAIHRNGSACDFISEGVIAQSVIRDGYLRYGPRRYHTVFLLQVESLEPAAAARLAELVAAGGRVCCIGAFPDKAPGWSNHLQRDGEVVEAVARMQAIPRRCLLLPPPGKDVTAWYKGVQEQHGLAPYVRLDAPDPFVSQARYRVGATELLLFMNSSTREGRHLVITPEPEMIAGKQAWLWDPETGTRGRLPPDASSFTLDLGPAELKLLVFDKERRGPLYRPVPKGGAQAIQPLLPWSVTGRHTNGTVISGAFAELKDLKEVEEWTRFAGTVTYRASFELPAEGRQEWLNLGRVFGVSEVWVNGQPAGTKWYGHRIFDVKKMLRPGQNFLEIKIVTTLGNYLKSLTGDPVARFWTNEGRAVQPLQSQGLVGPVTIY
ncbi:glycosyl hydrolase [Paraflavisolibacter sp. H34]|uniref:glycosyl hydrolase n=1 Tax=Huijunlia imazamoxiresistens TaxID=3127457 RepID=UPI00301B57C4